MPKRKDSKINSTVKCGLRKHCLSDELFIRIQNDVREMSALAIESSRYILWDLMRKWDDDDFPQRKIDFGYYFKALCIQEIRANRRLYVLDPEYSELRGDLPLYSCKLRSNIREQLINGYEMAFQNNLKVHAYKRLSNFFRKFGYEYRDMRDTLGYLFHRETDSVPDQILLNCMIDHLEWDQQRLYDIDSDEYFKHIKLFYRLQRFNETNRYKNFKLIPQHHYGAIHIRYDTQAMFHLLNSMKLIDKKNELNITDEQKAKKNWRRNYYQNNNDARRNMWLAVFKPPETNTKEFDYTISTDGVAVSFGMHKKGKKTEQVSSDGRAIGLYLYTFIDYKNFFYSTVNTLSDFHVI